MQPLCVYILSISAVHHVDLLDIFLPVHRDSDVNELVITSMISAPVVDGLFVNGPLSAPLPSPLDAWFDAPSASPSIETALPIIGSRATRDNNNNDKPVPIHRNNNANRAVTTVITSPVASPGHTAATMPSSLASMLIAAAFCAEAVTNGTRES